MIDGSSILGRFNGVSGRMDRVGVGRLVPGDFNNSRSQRGNTGASSGGAAGTDPFSQMEGDFDQGMAGFDRSVCIANQKIDYVEGIDRERRCRGLREQGIQPGAESVTPNEAIAQVVDPGGVDNRNNDWRVSLSLPEQLAGGPVLAPIASAGKMVFPFNPTILFGNSANYSQVHPTHTNYVYNAYQNSQVSEITINGEFFNESVDDCRYWIAVIHYLRTMTKMFYGEGPLSGNPPLIARLNGYGKHVLNNIPVVITNFTTDLPNDVDYIPVNVDGELNYVPSQSLVTVTCAPQYSRRIQSTFNLKSFAAGGFVKNGTSGFI
jgi:hypothetical protein